MHTELMSLVLFAKIAPKSTNQKWKSKDVAMKHGQENMELFSDQRNYPMKFFKFFRARETDPLTSHKAAEEIKEVAPQHMDLIYNCLLEHGPMGKDGIARLTGLNPNQVARRLPELQKVGLVATTGQTVYSDAGRSEREWILA